MQELVLVLFLLQYLGNRFNGIYVLHEFSIANAKIASAFVDKSNHVHILISTLASVRSYNIKGQVEWIKPGVKYFGNYDRTYKFRTNFITLTKPLSSNSLIVFSVDIRNGKTRDSLVFVGKGLYPMAQGLRGNYFILRERQNTPYDEPLMHVFKLNDRGKMTLCPPVRAGFIEKTSNFWKDDLIILDMWAPMNFENPSRAGIIDSHVGAALISTSTGLVLNRFMIPFEGFAYSYVIYSPEKLNSFILSYRGNFRNLEQFSGFYEISLPTFREIHHWEIKGNIYPTPIMLNGRFIAGVDVQNKTVIIIDADSFKIMRRLGFEKYLMPLELYWGHLTKRRGITVSGSMDVNHDGIDDLVVIYHQIYASTDPVWANIHNTRGKVIGNTYLFVILGPDYKEIYPLVLPLSSDLPAVKLIPWKNILILFSYSDAKVTVYRLF